MMTKDALLWRLKYLLAMVALFMITSFTPPAASDCGSREASAARPVQAPVALAP
jgi:hypothetical protein